MAEGRRKAAEREAKAKAKRAREEAKSASQELPQAKTAAILLPSASPSMQNAFSRKPATSSNNSGKHKHPRSTKTQYKSPEFSGSRGAGGERNTFFRTRALTAREQSARAKSPIRQKLHADGQAALNAIRKASPGFKIGGPVRLGCQILLLAGGCWMEWAAPGLGAHPKHKGAAAAFAASS